MLATELMSTEDVVGRCLLRPPYREIKSYNVVWASSDWLSGGWLWEAGVSDLGIKRARSALNGTNPGLFQIRFQNILAPRAKMY